jgi:16S rRNA A1518/A1519 N6-dimethyltransferase RsmA/KsgA/DIM1 with predicted DNA glycosylase/AP lyase activity
MLENSQLIAETNNEVYVKEKNEDFMTLLSGIMGQKKRIHIHIGDVLDQEINAIKRNLIITTNKFKLGTSNRGFDSKIIQIGLQIILPMIF